jgi:hypothetical protein
MKIPKDMDIIYHANYQKLFRLRPGKNAEIYVNINGTRNRGRLAVLATRGRETQIIPSGHLPSTIWDGKWHCLEFRFDLANDILNFWLDGKLYYLNTNYNWAGAAGKTFWRNYGLGHFPMGNRAGRPLSEYQPFWRAMEFDNLVVSDSYIGPLK